eukprot:9626760-Alexandrium_andersonii.AAC.1
MQEAQSRFIPAPSSEEFSTFRGSELSAGGVALSHGASSAKDRIMGMPTSSEFGPGIRPCRV